MEPGNDGHLLVVDDLTDDELDYYDHNPQVRRQRNPMLLDRAVPALLTEIEHSLDLVEPLASYLPRPLLEVMVETAQDRRIPVELSESVVMFVKLEGFDTNLEGVDSESVHERMQVFSSMFARLDAAAAARGGMLRRVTYQATGSDVLVCFGVLNAHTDDPERAASMALAVSDLVAAAVAEAGPAFDTTISYRVGMSLGPVFAGEMGVHLGRREFNVVGDPVNVAARLAAKAEPGSVLVSPSVAARLGEGFVVRAKGQMALRGKSEPMEIIELQGAAGS
ncbi:MAG: adenylate/guanylate cyclase domain-containing protein [Ilumatobacteraceae bacterium]